VSAKFPIFFGIAITMLALGMWFGWFSTADSRLLLTGEILKVRTMELTPETTLAILDFRMKYDSNILFALREASVVWTAADGSLKETDPVARPDLERIMQYAKQAGPKYNEMFVMGEKLTSKAMVDRMAAGVVKAPEADFLKRKSVTLRLTDMDGKTFELHERGAVSK
jgi:hypothetical protein